MPKLGTINATRLTLPSSTDEDPAWCEVKKELLLGDIASAMGEANSDEDNDIVKAINMLSVLITAWNFTDEDGNPVEPSKQWIQKLTTPDFTYLSQWVKDNIVMEQGALTNDEKKALSSPSTEPVSSQTVSPPII